MFGSRIAGADHPLRTSSGVLARGHLMALGVVLAAVVAGCGSSSSSSPRAAPASPPPTTGAPSATGATKATIASFKFVPATITVKKGASVTFDNKDNADHTVTADGGAFDSGTIAQGASKKLTFSKSGTFPYHCSFHPFMHGTMVVQ